jgi:hypothetical protein
MNTSQTLDKQKRRLIGRKSEKPAELETFGIGNTTVYFHLEENSEQVKTNASKQSRQAETF